MPRNTDHHDCDLTAAKVKEISRGALELTSRWTRDIPMRLRDTVSCRCTVCGENLQRRLASLLKGLSSCSLCSRLTSVPQHDLNAWITSLGIKTVQGDRTVLPPTEIDVWIPSAKLGVEYHGLYWHSEPADRAERKHAHARKYEAARAAGIRVLQVYEDEWRNRRFAVEHLVLGALGMVPRIGARELRVEVIPKRSADKFYDRYHVQGAASQGIHYALMGVRGPVSVMTFASRASQRGAAGATTGQWELSRFASSMRVAGGASRLWAAFLADHNPAGVVTYCDHRYFDGGVYTHLGFTAVHTKVDYEYVWNGDRWRKSFGVKANLYKHLGIEPEAGDTETKLAVKLGARRLWNAGRTTFHWGDVGVEATPDGEVISPEQIQAAWDARFKTSLEKRNATISKPAYVAARRAAAAASWEFAEGTPEFENRARELYAAYLENPTLFLEQQRVEFRKRYKDRAHKYRKPLTDDEKVKRKAYMARYYADPERKAERKAYHKARRESGKGKEDEAKRHAKTENVEKRKARQREYYYSPQGIAARKARQATDEFKAKNRERQRALREKKKVEQDTPLDL